MADRSCTPAPSRRALFGGALGFALAPLAAAAARHRRESTWADLTPSLAFMHPDGLKTARHAQAAGLKVADIYCIMFIGDHAPSLLFKDGAGVRTTVNAKGIAL